ncbi:Hypothetical predicted protein [Paramuricea clavata]|uniref:Uncharacterized protein n=1 Tax=Paramuricea clavata TaxID=317549 RepID=A0A7D9ECS0_PARCT|nr:Hypothetical predicted protein [Paramuricea clavata]
MALQEIIALFKERAQQTKGSNTTRSYLIRTDKRDVRICQELYSQQSCDYSEEIEDLAEIISPGYEIPIETEEALQLFVTITTELDCLRF